ARRTTWKGSITATAAGISSAAAVLKPVNPSIATTSTASRPAWGALGKPGLERGLGAARDHVQQPRWTRTGAHRREVDDHGDVLVPATGVAPHVLIDPDDLHTVQPAGIVDQPPSALGQDRVVGGVPRDAKPLGDASDAQVLTHDRLQRPGQSTTRQPGPRLGRAAGVLAPHMPTPGAPVPADRHQQGGRSPSQRLLAEPPPARGPGGSCTRPRT